MSLSKQMIPIKNFGGIVYEERNAGNGAIKPGMLCKVQSDGTVIPHDSAGGKVENLVAIEDALQGKTVSDLYVTGYPVRLMRFRPGEEFFGLLHGHCNITMGEHLCSKGDGTFRSSADSGSYGDTACAVALETLDLSSSGTDTLIHLRAL